MRVSSSSSPIRRRVTWDSDGPVPSISSLSCVIDWMTVGDNYSRYRGGDGQRGESKKRLAGEIVRMINDSGVQTSRNAKDVINKISNLEALFKIDADWIANTGQGRLDDEVSLG